MRLRFGRIGKRASDVTGRHVPELAGEAARLLLDHTREMVCTLDLDGRFTSVNRAGERLTGYTADQLAGRLAVDLIAPEHRREAARQFQERLRGADARPPDATVLLTRDGSRVPIEVTSATIEHGGRAAGVLGVITDVSARRRAEDALQLSEQRFGALLEAAPDGIVIVDAGGRITLVNAQTELLFGYARDELVGRPIEMLVPQHLDVAHRQHRSTYLASPTVQRMGTGLELEGRRKDGSSFPVDVGLSSLETHGGRVVVASVRDVTEHKQTVAELARRESQLAEAQHVARIGSWELEYATGEVSMSRELHRLYGLEVDTEVTPALLAERVYPPDRERVIAVAGRRLEAGQSSELEFRVVLPDGRLRWLYSRSEPVLADGVPTGKRGIAEDITERMEAEKRLADAEERYRRLVEQLPLAIYVRPLDMSQPNFYASPQVESMLGYPRELWESDPDLLARAIHPDDREHVLAEATRIRAGGTPVPLEYRYLRADGEIVWVEDETHLVCDEEGRPLHVQGFLREITRQRQAEAERDRLREELHHAQKLEALGRLAGGVAHDFNNMLTAIKGYSELLLEDAEAGTPAHDHGMQIRRAAEQAAALPQQLLAFGRRQTLEPSIVDVHELLGRTTELLRHAVGEAIEVAMTLASRPALAHIDGSRLGQVMINLALNARDAMPDGGTLSITTAFADVGDEEAREHGAARGGYVVISVADDGHGMDADTQSRVFEPFFTTKPQEKGSGLGLSSAYGTITQSGGFIRLESEPGRGSVFHLHLPVAAAEDGPESSPAPPSVAAGRRPLALLVEDEEIVRTLVASILTGAGFDVHATADGAEADAWLRRQAGETVAVLVTDVVMPKIRGDELARRARELQPGIPIVLVSGYSEEPMADVRPRPGTAFLQKPFSNEALLAAVRSVMEARGSGAEGPEATAA